MVCIANSHGHLQQSRNPHTNNLKTVLCHTCIGWVPSGINWAKLLLQVLKSKTQGGCRIIDFMYTLHYIGPNQCIGENERKKSCLTQHHSERGKPCTPTCDSNVHSEPCWKWDLIYSTLYCGPALQSHWFHSKQSLLPLLPLWVDWSFCWKSLN